MLSRAGAKRSGIDGTVVIEAVSAEPAAAASDACGTWMKDEENTSLARALRSNLAPKRDPPPLRTVRACCAVPGALPDALCAAAGPGPGPGSGEASCLLRIKDEEDETPPPPLPEGEGDLCDATGPRLPCVGGAVPCRAARSAAPKAAALEVELEPAPGPVVRPDGPPTKPLPLEWIPGGSGSRRAAMSPTKALLLLLLLLCSVCVGNGV